MADKQPRPPEPEKPKVDPPEQELPRRTRSSTTSAPYVAPVQTGTPHTSYPVSQHQPSNAINWALIIGAAILLGLIALLVL